MMKKVRQKAGWGTLFVAALVATAVLVPDERLIWLGTGILLVMIIPANYFPIFYTVAFRWWAGHLGRALFTKALGLAIILDVAMYFRFYDEQPWVEEVRFVAYTLVLTGMIYQSVVMTVIRWKARKPRGPQESQTDVQGIDIH